MGRGYPAGARGLRTRQFVDRTCGRDVHDVREHGEFLCEANNQMYRLDLGFGSPNGVNQR